MYWRSWIALTVSGLVAGKGVSLRLNGFGLNKDVGLTGAHYNIALTVFFLYAVFEVPSNIVLELLKPSQYISTLLILWGSVMIEHDHRPCKLTALARICNQLRYTGRL